MENANSVIALSEGSVVIHDPGFMKLVSLEPRLEGDKIFFPFQLIVDFEKMAIQPSKINIIANMSKVEQKEQKQKEQN